jgi:16S rRNA processing protein RimM
MKVDLDLVNRPKGHVHASEGRLIAIAEVARPHGVRGELRLKVYNAESDVIARGRKVVLRRPPTPGGPKKQAAAAPERVSITAARPIEGGVLIRLEGVDTREDAEALRGTQLLVDRDELPEAAEGEFYAVDVEGCRAELVTGDVIGTVKHLVTYPTCDVLVVERLEGGGTLEVPLTDAFVDEVDVEAHVVRIKTIEGLT